MNKKILVVVFCLSMVATIPIAAGMQPRQNHEPSGIFGRTYICGIILGLRTNGRYTSFIAVFCHYTVYRLLHSEESGYIVLEQVTFNKRFSGFQGDFFIRGTFQGTKI